MHGLKASCGALVCVCVCARVRLCVCVRARARVRVCAQHASLPQADNAIAGLAGSLVVAPHSHSVKRVSGQRAQLFESLLSPVCGDGGP